MATTDNSGDIPEEVVDSLLGDNTQEEQPTTTDVSVSPAPQPASTDDDRSANRRRLFDKLTSDNIHHSDVDEDMDAAPSFWEGAEINQKDDGAGTSLYHLFLDTFQPIADEEDRAGIDNNLDVLRKDVPEEFWEEIETQLNFQSALRKSDMVRERLRNEGRLAKQGLVTGFGSAAAGFLIDPINLVPGALLAKTARTGYKAAASWNVTSNVLKGIGSNAALKHTTNFAALAGLGMAEEAIRQIPRMEIDPTYNYDDYKFDVVVGSLIGGGLSLGISGVSWLDSATFDVQQKLFSIENQMRVEKATTVAANLGREFYDSVSSVGLRETITNNPKDIVGKAMDKANREVALKRVKMEPHNIMNRISKLEDPTPEDIDMIVRDSVKTIAQNLTKTVGKENRPEMIRMVDELQAKLDPEAEAREAKAADDLQAAQVDPTFKREPDERSVEQALNDAAKDIERVYKELDTFLQSEEVAKMYNVEGIFCEM